MGIKRRRGRPSNADANSGGGKRGKPARETRGRPRIIDLWKRAAEKKEAAEPQAGPVIAPTGPVDPLRAAGKVHFNVDVGDIVALTA